MVTVGLWLLNTSVGKYSLQSLPAIQVEDLATGFTFLLNLPGFKNRGSIICLVYLKKKSQEMFEDLASRSAFSHLPVT